MKKKAVTGGDGVTRKGYGRDLEARLSDLQGRIHRRAYRARPSRRTWILKSDGRRRPLGIAALEDKVVQYAVGTVLNQIWEEDFLGFSYGFRPGRGQQDALDALWVGIVDLWVEQWRKKPARGDVILVRYADDAVLGFQHREEAEQFLEQLRERLRKFGLELHPDKTRLIEFRRYAAERRKKRGEGKPETFNFLGLTHICGTNHQTGNFAVHRRTIGKRMAAKLKEIRAELRRRMHGRVSGTVKWLRQVVRGYFQYHAIPGNWARMKAFRNDVLRIWFQALRRRSQRSRLSWDRFRERLGVLLPPVQILQPYPDVRFDVKHPNIRGRNRVR